MYVNERGLGSVSQWPGDWTGAILNLELEMIYLTAKNIVPRLLSTVQPTFGIELLDVIGWDGIHLY